MTQDRSFVELNCASTERIRALAAHLSDKELQHPVGEHWTIAITLAHLAFWDRRVLFVLDKTEQDGKLFIPQLDIVVNDLSLPLWAAIPPREAARLAIETAAILDQRLEHYPATLLEEIYIYNKRWVVRSLHRGEHLDEAEAAVRHDGDRTRGRRVSLLDGGRGIAGGDPVIQLEARLGRPLGQVAGEADAADGGVIPEKAVAAIGQREGHAALRITVGELEDRSLLI